MPADVASPLIPETGLTVGERSLRIGWFTNLRRSEQSRPLQTVDFVARQGRAVRVVDLREAGALTGELGHVPGADWVPLDEASQLAQRVGPWEPLVLVSSDGEDAARCAGQLEQQGLKMVAAMEGGMRAWVELGFASSRDPALTRRRGALGPLPAWSTAPSEQPISLEELQAHVGHPATVRWIRVAALLLHGRMSCVDGRDHTAVVGSPGGDAGEFILAVAALESLLGRAVDEEVLAVLLRRRLDAFGRFAYHTDAHAGDKLIATIRADERTRPLVEGMTDPLVWRRWFYHPPEGAHPALLDFLSQPQHTGCGHLRLMMQHPDAYGVRPGLVAQLLRRCIQHRWNGAPEIEVAPLPGGHAEGAVVNIHVPGQLQAFSRIPLVAPSVGGRQVFVNHPDVAAYFRSQLALWLAQQDDLHGLPESTSEQLVQRMQALHAQQLGVTLSRLAAGLPIYDVTVRRDGTVQVRQAGQVPPAPGA